MNILHMYVLQCILCASEQKYFRIYGVLQIKMIISMVNQEQSYLHDVLCLGCLHLGREQVGRVWVVHKVCDIVDE